MLLLPSQRTAGQAEDEAPLDPEEPPPVEPEVAPELPPVVPALEPDDEAPPPPGGGPQAMATQQTTPASHRALGFGMGSSNSQSSTAPTVPRRLVSGSCRGCQDC